jgi:hypothetical protein
MPLCFAALPFTFVDVSGWMDEHALTLGHVIDPAPFISGIIRPLHSTSTVSVITFPFAFVYCSRPEMYYFSIQIFILMLTVLLLNDSFRLEVCILLKGVRCSHDC